NRTIELIERLAQRIALQPRPNLMFDSRLSREHFEAFGSKRIKNYNAGHWMDIRCKVLDVGYQTSNILQPTSLIRMLFILTEKLHHIFPQLLNSLDRHRVVDRRPDAAHRAMALQIGHRALFGAGYELIGQF